MALNYEYKYAIVRTSDGLCIELRDSTDYILRPEYVPIEEELSVYFLKYYWPLPEVVNSFDDFQGSWWSDAAHTTPLVIE